MQYEAICGNVEIILGIYSTKFHPRNITPSTYITTRSLNFRKFYFFFTGQDIMYNASRDNIKTVKHIELGIFTKRKTGSKLLINCLNRLGHSISYSDVNKIETDIANRQLINGNLRTCVPGGLQPGNLLHLFLTIVIKILNLYLDQLLTAQMELLYNNITNWENLCSLCGPPNQNIKVEDLSPQ